MKLTDLQWQIDRLLVNSSLDKDERIRLQREINDLIANFGKSLISDLGVIFDEKK